MADLISEEDEPPEDPLLEDDFLPPAATAGIAVTEKIAQTTIKINLRKPPPMHEMDYRNAVILAHQENIRCYLLLIPPLAAPHQIHHTQHHRHFDEYTNNSRQGRAGFEAEPVKVLRAEWVNEAE